jgi:hypothetical protein
MREGNSVKSLQSPPTFQTLSFQNSIKRLVCRWGRPQGCKGVHPSSGQDDGHGDAPVQVRPPRGTPLHGQMVQRRTRVLQVHPQGVAQHAGVSLARTQRRRECLHF